MSISHSIRFLYPTLFLLAVITTPLEAQWRNTNPFHEWAGEFTELGMIWLLKPAGLWPLGDTDGDGLPDFVLKRGIPDTAFKHFEWETYGSELLLFRGVHDTVPSAEIGKRLGPPQWNVHMDFIGAGDWDGDGHQDLAIAWMQLDDSTYGVTGTTQYEMFVYWGNATGEYSLEDTTRLSGRGDAWGGLRSGVTGDIDLDGVDDLCLQTGSIVRLVGGGMIPSPRMSIWRGHKGKRWGRDEISRRADWEWWTAPVDRRFGEKLIDQNCDGAPDVVMYDDELGAAGASITILYGTPGGGLPDTSNVEKLHLKEPHPGISAQLMDITNDNVLDLVVLDDYGMQRYGHDSQHVRVYPGEPGERLLELYGDGTNPWARFPTPIVLHSGWGGYWGNGRLIWDLGDCNDNGDRDLYFSHYPFFLVYSTGRALDSLIDGGKRFDGLYPFDYVNVGDISGRGRDAYAVVHTKGVHFIEGGRHINQSGVGRRLPHTPDVSRCDSPVSVSDREDALPVSTMELRVYPNPSSSDVSVEWVMKSGSPGRVEITDQAGKVIHTRSLTEATGVLTWRTEGVPSGTYRIVLHSDRQSIAKSVILQH